MPSMSCIWIWMMGEIEQHMSVEEVAGEVAPHAEVGRPSALVAAPVEENLWRLWTIRVCRADDHNVLVTVQVFPEATLWELKVVLSYHVAVDPNQITLYCEGKQLLGGVLRSMSRLGVRDLALVVMNREPSKKRKMVIRGGVPAAVSIALASAGVMVTTPVTHPSKAGDPFPRKECLEEIALLGGKRRCLSAQLVKALVAMAGCPTGVDQDSAELRYLNQRLDLGETMASVDSRSGFTGLQLAVHHARSPCLALMLLHPAHCPDLKAQRRDPCTLLFDEGSQPLLMVCDLMADHILLSAGGGSGSAPGLAGAGARTTTTHGRVDPVESALAFTALFPPMVASLRGSWPVLRASPKVMGRVTAALHTLEEHYLGDEAFGAPADRLAVRSAFKSLTE
jgi:hypothetical protein